MTFRDRLPIFGIVVIYTHRPISMPRKHSVEQSSLAKIRLSKKLFRPLGTLLVLSAMVAGLFQMSEQQVEQIAYTEGSFEEALARAAEADRLCFVSFETEFCYPCRTFEHRIQTNPELKDIIQQQYTPYRIDPLNTYTGGKNLARMYGVEHLPTLLITDSGGREIFRVEEEAQWDSLKMVLESHASLRVPPKFVTPSLLGKRASAPLHIAKDSLSDMGFEEMYNRRYSLSLGKYDSYQDARDAAKDRQSSWNQSIWIQPRGQKFELLIGSFESKKAAKVTRKFLQLWEDVSTKVAPLRDRPIVLAD